MVDITTVTFSDKRCYPIYEEAQSVHNLPLSYAILAISYEDLKAENERLRKAIEELDKLADKLACPEEKQLKYLMWEVCKKALKGEKP